MQIGSAWGSSGKTEPNFQHRVLYTALFVLAFRVLALIPVFDVDQEKLSGLLANNPLIGALDLFAGGEVLNHFSLVAAGLLPYLLATMLVSGVTWAVPHLRELEKAGEKGKKRIELYRKLMSVPLSLVFGWGISHYLARQTGFFPGHIHWYDRASFWSSFRIVGLVTLGSVATAGITHGITKKGIGDGAKVILLVGATMTFLEQILTALYGAPNGSIVLQRLALITIFGAIVAAGSLHMVRAQRKIPINYARRQSKVSQRYTKKDPTYIPFLLNRGGVLPVSAAVGLLALLQFGNMYLESHLGGRSSALRQALAAITSPESGVYWIALALLLMLFVALYNFTVLWKPYENEDLSLAELMKRQWVYFPGVRPGAQTEKYLTRAVARMTVQGALGLALLATVIPYVVFRLTGWNALVTLMSVIVFAKTFEALRSETESYRLQEKIYNGLLRKGRLRGRENS